MKLNQILWEIRMENHVKFTNLTKKCLNCQDGPENHGMISGQCLKFKTINSYSWETPLCYKPSNIC